jgi:hypothetical protein
VFGVSLRHPAYFVRDREFYTDIKSGALTTPWQQRDLKSDLKSSCLLDAAADDFCIVLIFIVLFLKILRSISCRYLAKTAIHPLPEKNQLLSNRLRAP